MEKYYKTFKEFQINEISSDTFKSAIDKSKERGTDNRTHKLSELFFKDFIGKPLLDGNIKTITTINPKQGRYRNLIIVTQINKNFGDKTGLVDTNISYDIDADLYNIDMKIDRKDAFMLYKIAKHINPDTKYKNVAEHFNIKGY